MNVFVATRVKINKCKPLKKQVMTKAKQVVHFLIIHGNILNPFKFQAKTGHFLRIRQWGGHLQKGTILYQVWRNDRWLLVTKSLV